MSLKSLKREAKKGTAVPNDLLQQQKAAIESSMLEFFGVAALFFLFFCITLMIDFIERAKQTQNGGMILAELIVFVVFAESCVSAVKRFCVFRKISKVEFSSEGTVSIHCKKISFMYIPVTKGTSSIDCIVLKDEYGKKYFYVYPKKKRPDSNLKKEIREKYLDNEMQFICYKNTNFIKILPM